MEAREVGEEEEVEEAEASVREGAADGDRLLWLESRPGPSARKGENPLHGYRSGSWGAPGGS